MSHVDRADKSTPSVAGLSAERYAEVFRRARLPWLLIDPATGMLVDANEAAALFYGWSVEKLRTMSIADINTLPRERIRDELQNVMRVAHGRFLFPHRLASGEVREVEVDACPVHDGDRPLLLVTVQDLSEQVAREARLRGAVGAQRILLREIHHRVKNNLQVVSSLLSLQAGHAEQPEVRAILLETQARVRALALVHDLLHPAESGESVDFGAYLGDLVGHLFRVFGREPDAMKAQIEIEPIALDPATANPLGLIVNELVTNALKYAFPEGRSGTVQVGLRREGTSLILTVADDGVGLPEDLDLAHRGSLGLGLVLALADQLDASVEIHRRGGTRFVLSFRPAEGLAA